MKNNLSIKEDFDFALKNHQKNNLKIAEKFYKKILKINPDHFESNFLLGTLLAQTKDLDQAKQLLEKSIKINPNYAEAHNNLGNVQIELKEFEKAKSCYGKAIQIKPNYVDAYYNYGNVLKSTEEYEKAINYYKKVIEIKSNHSEAYNNLGVVLKELGEHQKAKSCYEKAIQIKPNYAEAHYNLGLIFRELNELKNAINFFQKAIEIRPNFSNAYAVLGLIFGNIGDFQKAINCYEKAIKYEPNNLYNYFSLSFLKKKILDSDLKNKIEKIVKNSYTTKRNLAYGNYLLAKYEREINNYENDLNYLIKGHSHYFEFKKRLFENQNKYWFDFLPNINKLIDAKKLNKNIKKNNHQIKPIFIVGVPRCGSTLVEKIIASGSKYIPIGEETAILDGFVKQKIKKKDSKNSNEENFKIKLINAYEKKGLIQKKSDYQFTDKSLENFFYIGLIKEIFPNAKIINCKRRALSCIMSIFQNNLTTLAWTHNLKYIFKYFDIYYKMIENFKKTFPGFIYELEYDKFINDPEIESKKLLKYCDLPWDKKCLEFYKRKDIVSKTISRQQIRKPIYKHETNRYLPYKKFLNKYGNKYFWFN